jgi:hypothetical protein
LDRYEEFVQLISQHDIKLKSIIIIEKSSFLIYLEQLEWLIHSFAVFWVKENRMMMLILIDRGLSDDDIAIYLFVDQHQLKFY